MIKDDLVTLREKALDKPFMPRLSEIVDRIDQFIDEEYPSESDDKSERQVAEGAPR